MLINGVSQATPLIGGVDPVHVKFLPGKPPRDRCHLGCILLKTAMSLLAGRDWTFTNIQPVKHEMPVGTLLKSDDGVRGWAPTTVVVQPARRLPGPPVSPTFVGLSTETSNGALLTGPASAPHRAVAQALMNFKLLTPGAVEGPVIRVGGNSADNSCWISQADDNQSCVHDRTTVPCCAYNISETDLESYAAFAGLDSPGSIFATLNASFALTMNLGYGPDPARAAAEVVAIARHPVRHAVSSLEIGNVRLRCSCRCLASLPCLTVVGACWAGAGILRQEERRAQAVAILNDDAREHDRDGEPG